VPNVREFVDEVARIALLNPALQKAGAQLIASFGDPTKFENSLKQVDAMLKLVRGQSINSDDKGRIGLPDTRGRRSDPFESQVNSVNKHIAAMQADAAAVDATAGEHARLRTEAQLLEAAQRNGAEVTDANRKRIAELGQAASDAATALARANVASRIQFGQSTMFLTQQDVSIARQLKDLYPDVATALGSVEAAQLRMNSNISQLSQSTLTPINGDLTEIRTGDDA